MKSSASVRPALGLLATLISLAVRGESQGPPAPRWILVYAGAPSSHHTYPRYTIDDLTRLVAVVDTAGELKSWLSTGAVFLELYAPSTRVFTDWIGGSPATGADWREYLDTIFAPGGPMARLDSAVGIAVRAVGPRNQTYQTAVMIPYPDDKVSTLEYDGRTYSVNKTQDGAALAAAYMRDVGSGFRRGRYHHLTLDAIYWLHESIAGSDKAVVRGVAQEAHKLGFQFFWAPYFTAPGSFNWRQFGFDEAWMQPNYFFSLELPATRVDSAFAIAQRLGMGAVVELDDRLLTSPQHAGRLLPYLSRLQQSPDFRNRSLLIYEGHGGLLALSRSTEPFHQALYRLFARVVSNAQRMPRPQ